MTKLLHTSRLAICLIMLISATVANAAKPAKLTGANGLKFGWSLEKCVETVGNVPRKMTTGKTGDPQRQFSYAPARWGGMEWDGCVLDFSRDKLGQIGFYKATATDSRDTFNAAKSHLTDLLGQPVQVQQTDNNLLWQVEKGNMALLQYAREKDPKTGRDKFATYLFLIDNKLVIKKAKRAESFLQELMKE